MEIQNCIAFGPWLHNYKVAELGFKFLRCDLMPTYCFHYTKLPVMFSFLEREVIIKVQNVLLQYTIWIAL